METIPLWSLIPLAVALALALLLSGRSHMWSDPPFKPEQPKKENYKFAANDFKSQMRQFVFAHYLETLLIGFSLFLLIYLVLSAPAQLTGNVPIEPNQPGRPFYFLHSIRDFLKTNYNLAAVFCNLFCGLIALLLTLTASAHRSPLKARFSLLWSSLSLAGSAQWMLSNKSQINTGIILYLLTASGFMLWSQLAKKSINENMDEPHPIAVHTEISLVILVLALATFGRMVFLKSIPYGIEGDEAKWTAEVVSLNIRGEPTKLALYHRDALPTSFYMQTLFHKILGPSIFAARFEVAFFSILATLIFYLLVRQIATVPLSLLAAWFLSASIFDIGASRVAHVESHVKIWVVLTLALLAWAIKTKRWQVYAIAGIALAFGMLTYDTVWPLALVSLLLVIIEAQQHKDTVNDTIRNLSALLTPSILTLPLLIPYIADRMSYYQFDGRKGDLASLWGYFSDVAYSWYTGSFHDFLYNRTGPLLNAFLLPWMTFGLVIALTNPRRRLSFWTLIWALLFIIPIPVAAHSPFGRIYYPALPAAYIFVAIGLYLFGKESLRALGNEFRPLIITVSLLILIWIPLFNLYIYFNEVYDYDDSQMRREIGELAGDVASPDTLIVLASVPQANEPLNNESQMVELFMLGKLPNELIKDSYKYIALENILPSLPTLTERPNLSIILDKVSIDSRALRNDLKSALRTCYPKASWVEGTFVDRVDINAEALSATACTSTGLSLEVTSNNNIHWALDQGTSNKVTLKCENQKSIHHLIQAETLPFTPGWNIETAVAPGWEGNGFLMDNFGSSPVLFEFELKEENPVYLWIRYYKRVPDNSPVQITINNQTLSFGAISYEKTNQWIWERVGPFYIPKGTQIISLERPYKDDPTQFMAIFVDEITITTDPNFTPANNVNQYLLAQTMLYSQEQNQGEIAPQLEAGSYVCYAEAFSNTPLVDMFGHTPVKSNAIDLSISP
ncbi:MAG: glycosyltransferase family 39 protein [Anaerolineales bacterium]